MTEKELRKVREYSIKNEDGDYMYICPNGISYTDNTNDLIFFNIAELSGFDCSMCLSFVELEKLKNIIEEIIETVKEGE